MRDPDALISTDDLARRLAQPELRVYDCTTYLEPPDPGSDDPYKPVAGWKSFVAGHIPGADFLDMQGELSDARHAAQVHDAVGRASGARFRPARSR